MTETRKWQLCILCQKQTEEKRVCPLANPVTSRREGAYTELISFVSQFRAIGATPHPGVELPEKESKQQNHASWHKSCRQLYRASALDSAKNVILKDWLQQEDPARLVQLLIVIYFSSVVTKQMQQTSRPFFPEAKTHPTDSWQGSCTGGRSYHGTLCRRRSRYWSKYSRHCYTGLSRCYDVICKQDTASENLEATTENELLQFIREKVTGGRRIFASKIWPIWWQRDWNNMESTRPWTGHA